MKAIGGKSSHDTMTRSGVFADEIAVNNAAIQHRCKNDEQNRIPNIEEP